MSRAGLPDRSGVGAPLPNPTGQSPRAAKPVSPARAEASRHNGARSRGPKTAAGKARSAQNALKHGLRAEKFVVLPQEDAAAFAALEAALVAELAPADALQSILVGRIAAAAWRLERAERLEVEVFAVRGWGGAGPGLTLIRDGNGTRSIETVMRYRAAALAELMRALRTLKTLQAEAAQAVAPAAGAAAARPGQAVEPAAAPAGAPARAGKTAVAPQQRAGTTAAGAALADRARANQPARATVLRLDDALPGTPAAERTLHEPAARWLPNEPAGPGEHASAAAAPASRPNEPEPFRARPTARD